MFVTSGSQLSFAAEHGVFFEEFITGCGSLVRKIIDAARRLLKVQANTPPRDPDAPPLLLADRGLALSPAARRDLASSSVIEAYRDLALAIAQHQAAAFPSGVNEDALSRLWGVYMACRRASSAEGALGAVSEALEISREIEDVNPGSSVLRSLFAFTYSLDLFRQACWPGNPSFRCN